MARSDPTAPTLWGRMTGAMLLGLSLVGAGVLSLFRGRVTVTGQKGGQRLTSLDSMDPGALLIDARRVDEAITADELSGARLIASELGSGSIAEQACILDAELNRAERDGKSLTAHLVGASGFYGPQGSGGRKASTRQPGNVGHLSVARSVLSGEARGISKGAVRFFDPKVQRNLHLAYKRGETGERVYSCHPLGTLKAWSYDLPKAGRYRCGADGMPAADAKPGDNPQAWVGHIDGVNPERLMLMRESSYGPLHDTIYAQARSIIESMG